MRNTRSRWLALVGATALLLTVAGTAVAQDADAVGNPYDEAGAIAGSGEGYKVGYLSLDESIPFVATVTNNIREQAEIAGLDLFVCGGSVSDELVNLDCARQFAVQELDGVISFNLHADSSAAICEAYENLPTVSIDIHQACETTFFGADNFNAGRAAGIALGEQLQANEDCAYDQVITLETFAAGEDINGARIGGMLDGFEEMCGAIPEDKLRREDVGGSVELAIEKIGPIIPTLPPGSTTIFFSLNDDMALGTLSQFRLADRADEVRIAAQGADSSSWAEMACFPNWMADTAYFPERYGRSTVPAIIDILDGNEVQNPIFTPAAAITPANVLDIYPQTTELYPETVDC